jgi:hypothetical protein
MHASISRSLSLVVLAFACGCDVGDARDPAATSTPTPTPTPTATATTTPRATPSGSASPTATPAPTALPASCDALEEWFDAHHDDLRGCASDGDCVNEYGACATFLRQCHYGISRESRPTFDAVRRQLDALHCRPDDIACEPCPAATPARCLAGRCEAGCEYVCNMDCECERDARGCDLPRCVEPAGCPGGAGCYLQSMNIDQVCVAETLPPDAAAHPFLRVTDRGSTCTGVALPCAARLIGDVLRVDPYYSVSPREDVVDCSPPPTNVTCVAPALAPGTYRVVVGNVPLGTLEVRAGGGGATVQRCVDLANPEEFTTCHLRPDLPFEPACVPEAASPGAWVAFTARDSCASCFDGPGPCFVQVRDGRIRVQPRRRACDCANCGACAEVCRDLTSECWVPPLGAGRYTVELTGDDEVRTLDVREAAPASCP